MKCQVQTFSQYDFIHKCVVEYSTDAEIEVEEAERQQKQLLEEERLRKEAAIAEQQRQWQLHEEERLRKEQQAEQQKQWKLLEEERLRKEAEEEWQQQQKHLQELENLPSVVQSQDIHLAAQI